MRPLLASTPLLKARPKPHAGGVGAALVRRGRNNSLTFPGSERLQEFNEIGFLSPGEIQLELPIVVIDHSPQIRRTSIVKIRRMLPESS